jgi:hypothetical protein
VEHVQPFSRPLPSRPTVVAAGLLVAVTLLVAAGLALVHRTERTRPEPVTRRVAKRPPTIQLRPRSRISVLVLNGNGTSGIAGATASQLLGSGYRSAAATNAPVDDYATSLVLYRKGWEGEARRLAKDAGIRVVSPLDGSLPTGSGGDQLVVVLGAN